MKKQFLLITILIISLQSFGQVDKVRDHLENAYSGVKKSWEYAGKAINEIQKCNLSTSLNDLQFNSGKAKDEIDEAALQAKEAESEADGIVSEAANLNWKMVGDGAGKAEKHFAKAKGKFDDASSNLGSAYNEESSTVVIDLINSAVNDIEKGMDYLKKGTDQLNDTFNSAGCKKNNLAHNLHMLQIFKHLY